MAAHIGNLLLDRLTLELQSFESGGGFFLEFQGFLVELDQIVRWTFEQTLTVGVQLDRRLGRHVGADNFLHVGVVVFQAGIATVTGDSPNRPAIHLQIGESKLNEGLAG